MQGLREDRRGDGGVCLPAWTAAYCRSLALGATRGNALATASWRLQGMAGASLARSVSTAAAANAAIRETR